MSLNFFLFFWFSINIISYFLRKIKSDRIDLAPPLGIEPRPTPSEGSRFRVSRANHYTTGEYSTRLIFFGPACLPFHHSPMGGEIGVEPISHKGTGFTVHLLLLKPFSFSINIITYFLWKIKFFLFFAVYFFFLLGNILFHDFTSVTTFTIFAKPTAI